MYVAGTVDSLGVAHERSRQAMLRNGSGKEEHLTVVRALESTLNLQAAHLGHLALGEKH